MRDLSRDQRRTVSIAWGIYAAFYLGRLNLSPALPVIAADLGVGLGEVGALGTVFFWCYAAGQIINGQLGNHLRPRSIVFAGLVAIAAANILFALQSRLAILIVLWGANGFAQSSGWGPILRIVSAQVTTAQKQRLSTLFSMSFQIGTAGAWALAGALLAVGGWRLAFWVPGALLLAVALVWRRSGLDADVTHDPPGFAWDDLRREVGHFLPVLLAAACVGFIYIGLLLWLPAFIQDTGMFPTGAARAVTAVVPLIGLLGMRLAGLLLARQVAVLGAIRVFLGMLCASMAFSAVADAAVWQGLAVLVALVAASGLAGLILSSAPMLLSGEERVSSAGGLLTALWSVGGGLSGTVVGGIAERAGWNAVFAVWLALGIVAFIAAGSVAYQSGSEVA